MDCEKGAVLMGGRSHIASNVWKVCCSGPLTLGHSLVAARPRLGLLPCFLFSMPRAEQVSWPQSCSMSRNPIFPAEAQVKGGLRATPWWNS